MKISAYRVVAVPGSTLLMVSGIMRYFQFGSIKEATVGFLCLLANIMIFCI
jgi:hypothetical protein